MNDVVYISTKEHLELYAKELGEREVPEFGLHIEVKDGTRTLKQNSAIHVYFKLLAEALNDAGYDMKRVIKTEIDIPWTGATVKEWLWKPIQKYVMDKKSTTQMKRKHVSEVYDVLARHLASRFGISVPFPQAQYPEDE